LVGESLEDAQMQQDQYDGLPPTTMHDIVICNKVKELITNPSSGSLHGSGRADEVILKMRSMWHSNYKKSSKVFYYHDHNHPLTTAAAAAPAAAATTIIMIIIITSHLKLYQETGRTIIISGLGQDDKLDRIFVRRELEKIASDIYWGLVIQSCVVYCPSTLLEVFLHHSM
jgi:hypothetical protein